MPRKRTGILGFPKPRGFKIVSFGRLAEPLPSDEDSDDDPDFVNSEEEDSDEATTPDYENEKQEPFQEGKCSRKKGLQQAFPEEHAGGNSDKRAPDGVECQLTDGKSGVCSSKRTKIVHFVTSQETKGPTNLWSDVLPAELLMRVFMYAVRCFGAVPFLCRVSRVCRRWSNIAAEPQFWKHTDLSHLANTQQKLTNFVIKLLCQTRLSAVEHLNLDKWSKVTDKNILMIAKQCPCLTTISLWGCGDVTGEAVSALVAGCPRLTSVDVSLTKVNTECIRRLVRDLGHQLQELYLRSCQRINGDLVVAYIQGACSSLRALDLTGTSVLRLNVEKLQAGCPELRELLLGNTKLRQVSVLKKKSVESFTGFPKLEQLSLACNTDNSIYIDGGLLERLLRTSAKLRVLDLRGCRYVGFSSLRNIPVPSLEEIFVSHTEATFRTAVVVIEKWSHSLRVLDLSCNLKIGDDTLDLIRNFTLPNATSLDLSATAVTSHGVRKALEGCPVLEKLNLSSCRGIPRGLKQQHAKEKLRILVLKLAKMGIGPESRALSAEQ